VIQGDFHRNVDVTQSRCRSTRHPVPTSSIPSLIHRFISRFADSASAASLVGAYARRHPSWTGWSPLFPLSRRNDRHLACNRCGFAAPGRRLFIDSAVLPASCMFVIAWANTCALHACVRACVRACMRLPEDTADCPLDSASSSAGGYTWCDISRIVSTIATL